MARKLFDGKKKDYVICNILCFIIISITNFKGVNNKKYIQIMGRISSCRFLRPLPPPPPILIDIKNIWGMFISCFLRLSKGLICPGGLIKSPQEARNTPSPLPITYFTCVRISYSRRFSPIIILFIAYVPCCRIFEAVFLFIKAHGKRSFSTIRVCASVRNKFWSLI